MSITVSQNLYAETLLKLLDPEDDEKCFENGRDEIVSLLTRSGIPTDAYSIADAPGLSRYNLLSPEMLIRLLQHAYRSKYRDDFLELLPIGELMGPSDDE